MVLTPTLSISGFPRKASGFMHTIHSGAYYSYNGNHVLISGETTGAYEACLPSMTGTWVYKILLKGEENNDPTFHASSTYYWGSGYHISYYAYTKAGKF